MEFGRPVDAEDLFQTSINIDQLKNRITIKFLQERSEFPSLSNPNIIDTGEPVLPVSYHDASISTCGDLEIPSDAHRVQWPHAVRSFRVARLTNNMVIKTIREGQVILNSVLVESFAPTPKGDNLMRPFAIHASFRGAIRFSAELGAEKAITDWQTRTNYIQNIL